jgi:hypothetical protein
MCGGGAAVPRLPSARYGARMARPIGPPGSGRALFLRDAQLPRCHLADFSSPVGSPCQPRGSPVSSSGPSMRSRVRVLSSSAGTHHCPRAHWLSIPARSSRPGGHGDCLSPTGSGYALGAGANRKPSGRRLWFHPRTGPAPDIPLGRGCLSSLRALRAVGAASLAWLVAYRPRSFRWPLTGPSKCHRAAGSTPFLSHPR